ncbi:sulfite oxidase-like oxidoreductase [Inquilinus limosus]|uniref:Sulfite oxidase-like oxidoreductase n=1 Tax=Inquilinus limosus TaxID=171674 RepID=A0A211ZPU8_9PROT|nr:sulfite oxidase-like oxidoreductase [Inquilinus limosus]OWJ67204.1 sulfite oxidase-like oxidoreductase [Inquilinus limosus]
MADDGDLGSVRPKLVESKKRWAREGRLLTGGTSDPERDRLPPGQRLVETWPVLDLGVQPEIPLDKWRLTIDGLVEAPAVWRWADILAQPEFEDVSDIHCVTSWSRYDNRWRGVSARHLLSLVRPKPEARHVVFHSYDTYTTNVALDAFAEEDVLLATHHDGEPISVEHGGPLRVIMPRWYFWKSAKWVKRIEFVAADRPGFWEERGYHNEGDPWQEQRYG